MSWKFRSKGNKLLALVVTQFFSARLLTSNPDLALLRAFAFGQGECPFALQEFVLRPYLGGFSHSESRFESCNSRSKKKPEHSTSAEKLKDRSRTSAKGRL